MDSVIILPLVSALIGSLIGAAASLGAIYIQQKNQTKRERIKLACDMALAERNKQIEVALQQGQSGSIAPVALFQSYHIELLTALEKGELTAEKIQELKQKNNQLQNAIDEIEST